MELKGILFLVFVYGCLGMLQARWVSWAQGKTSLQDRCLIPLILALLVLALTGIGLARATGWDTLGWFVLVHFGTAPLAGAVGLGTLAGLLLRRKRDKTNEKA